MCSQCGQYFDYRHQLTDLLQTCCYFQLPVINSTDATILHVELATAFFLPSLPSLLTSIFSFRIIIFVLFFNPIYISLLSTFLSSFLVTFFLGSSIHFYFFPLLFSCLLFLLCIFAIFPIIYIPLRVFHLFLFCLPSFFTLSS
jgi:hypothetical protein